MFPSLCRHGFYLNLVFIFGFSFQRIFRIEIFFVNLRLFGTFNFNLEPKTSYDIKVFMSTRIMLPLPCHQRVTGVGGLDARVSPHGKGGILCIVYDMST